MADDKEIERLLQKIAQLEAQNASLKQEGRINRQAKNDVFQDLFSKKKYLHLLYKDIHPEDKDITEADLTLITIENIFTIKVFNDLGMLARRKKGRLLILIESQSTWSINILFRLWEYVADSLMNFFINNGVNIYGSPKLDMPDIECYIVYTGKRKPRILSSDEIERDVAGRPVLSLNKEFFGGEVGKPELKATVIDSGNGSGILEEYIRFSQIFDEQMKIHGEDRARGIAETFRICTQQDVLKEYLEGNRSEVEKIMMTMVSPEYLREAEEKTERIRGAVEMGRDLGHSDSDIIASLVRRFHITPEYAQNCLDTEWEPTETYEKSGGVMV